MDWSGGQVELPRQSGYLLLVSKAIRSRQYLLLINSTLYILIGVFFEERKLLREFGEAYTIYKKSTPMLVPGLVFGRKQKIPDRNREFFVHTQWSRAL